MSVIVNLRGTSGAGKSTVPHTLLRMYDSEVMETFGKKPRPLVYKLTSPVGPLFVFGSYMNQCGGCDGITGYGEVLPELTERYARQGHVFYEGLLVSGYLGDIGRKLVTEELSGHTPYFALLDTPLELCIERIEARRAERGKTEPLNRLHTERKWKVGPATLRTVPQHMVKSIRHTHPVKDVLALYGIKLTREPKHYKADGSVV